MRIDPFHVQAGLLAGEGDATAAEAAAVRRAAGAFLAAGGRLTGAEWSALSDETRGAFVDAQRARDLDQAKAVGEAVATALSRLR